LYYTPEELKDLFIAKGYKVSLFDEDNNDSISKKITEESQGKPLWKIFILLTLIFLATEIALIRLWK
jgi:hypothetical protein